MRYRFIILATLLFSLIVLFVIDDLYSQGGQPYDKKRAEELYMQQCSKCHRKNGNGVKRVYPPVKNADYIRNNSSEELLRGMLFGRSGRITVNGVTYNGVMETEVDKSLSDYEIGLILTYVLWEFNGIEKIITPDDVKAARKAGKLAGK